MNFIYVDYQGKLKKKEEKKAQKLLKLKMKNKDDGIESNTELVARASIIEQVQQIDSYSDEAASSSGLYNQGNGSSGSGSGGSNVSTSASSSQRLKKKPSRGLKSHLALNELKLKIKEKIKSPQHKERHLNFYMQNAF